MGPSAGRRGGDRARVTIVAPLHDAGAALEDFLDRITMTAGGTAQLVLVDDASTDGTAARLRAHADGRSDVTVLVNDENLGVARSRNRALTVADREFVWFVDHDDDWDDTILDTLVAAAGDRHDVVVCRAEYRHDPAVPGRIVDGIDSREVVDRTGMLRAMLRGDVHGFLWTKLIRRSLLGTDPFPAISSQSDFVGVVRAVAAADSIAFVPDVLYRYLRREGSITRVRVPQLGNLAIARDALLDVVDGTGSLGADRALRDRFVAWFYCAAVAFTPIRQRAPRSVRAEGTRLARAALRGVRIRRFAWSDPRLAAAMVTLRWAPVVYRIAVPALLGVQGLRRTVQRGRSVRRGRPLGKAARA